MTFKEAKTRTLKLMDEYIPEIQNTQDEYIISKLAMAIDMAQKELCKIKRPVKRVSLESLLNSENKYIMPNDFISIRRVWQNGKSKNIGFCINKEFMLNKNTDSKDVVIEYFCFPKSIDDSTDDDYEFEIQLDLQEAIPFYAAIVIGASDINIDVSQIQNIYNHIILGIDNTQSNSLQVVHFN